MIIIPGGVGIITTPPYCRESPESFPVRRAFFQHWLEKMRVGGESQAGREAAGMFGT